MGRRARTLGIVTAGLLLALVPPPAVAFAAAPAAPVLVSPADGSQAPSSDVQLAVSASDPDGGQLSVRFEGREQGATQPGTGSGDPFTVVALPDLQNYTYNSRQGTIVQQAQWVVNTRSSLNTAMVVQLGDLVSEYDNLTQWGRTSSGLQVLDDAAVPNTVIPGNHDFNNLTGEFVQYDASFPPSRYAGKAWTPATARYGGYLGQNLFGPDPVDRRNMNNFALFSAGGRDFIVLNLEWETPQYALDWGARVLAAYPQRLAILTTHSFVQINGTRRTVPERTVDGIAAETAWRTFVSQQCQIRLVLSGHYHQGDLGEANRSDLNRCGQPVQQILTDYQDRANGGDGWLRYYTFDPAAATMTATTYSPKLNQFETDADSAFTVPFDLGEPQPAPFVPIATQSAPSGGTATVTWTGLKEGTTYEWRAVASDGTTASTSATWTVRTSAGSTYVDDTFTRNVSNGWGAADGTHAWTTKSTASSYSVDGAVGRITAPVGSTRGATLSGVSAGDVRLTTDLALAGSASGSGTYVSLHGRLATGNSYRAKLRYVAGGSVSLSLIRFTGSEVALATTTIGGLTATPGLPLRMVLELNGTSPTSLRSKVWPAGSTEPTAWSLSATDSTTALQSPGTTGIDVYTSGTAVAASAVSIDRFTAAHLGTAPPPNTPPEAVFAAPTVDGLRVDVNATGSTDPDGTITGYSWAFGDSTTGTGQNTSHTYATAGTYTITLTVTDDDGATDTATRSVTVTAAPPPNTPPEAVFAAPTVDGLRVDVNATGSTDPDGTITGYSWAFGDSTTGTGQNTSHTYATAGTYTITLTVTDDDGATDTATRSVTVTAAPPPNTPPEAVFAAPTVDGLRVDVNATGSTDPDGTITGYSWAFGDSTTGTGQNTSHTYATAGTYTITLTVTDDDGATDTATRSVTVTAPAGGSLAKDDFGRTISNAWGTADTGGAWTVTGATSRYAVGSGTGQQILGTPGITTYAALTGVSSTGTELRLVLSWSRTAAAGTLYASVVPRRLNSASDYRCKIVVATSGAMQLHLVRRLDGAESTLGSATIAGLTQTANTDYRLACRAVPTGSDTRVSGKLWRAGTSEPAAWLVSATDATAALQGAGGVAVSAYQSSAATQPVTLRVDGLEAVTP